MKLRRPTTSLRAETFWILNVGGLTLGNASQIAALAKQEFQLNAGLAEYLLWNVGLQVCTWWGDDPNLPAPDFTKVQTALLAPLKTWLSSDQSFRDPNCHANLLAAVRDALC